MYNVTYTSLPVLVMAIFDQVESTFRRDRPTVHVHRSSVFLHRFLTLSKLFCVSPHFENAPTFCCFTARRSLLLIVLDQHRPRSDLRGIRGRGPGIPPREGLPKPAVYFCLPAEQLHAVETPTCAPFSANLLSHARRILRWLGRKISDGRLASYL